MPTTRSPPRTRQRTAASSTPPPSTSTEQHRPPPTTMPTGPGTSRPFTTDQAQHEEDQPQQAATERRRAPSIQTVRSNTSATARIRQAEYEAEERLARIRRQQMEVEASLVRKRLAAEVAIIRDETDRDSRAGSERDSDTQQRVDEWMHRSAPRARRERFVARGERNKEYFPPMRKYTDGRQERTRQDRSPSCGGVIDHRTTRNRTPSREREPRRHRRSHSRDGIDRLADRLERMTHNNRPSRQAQDLPSFSGALNEWLPFKAAMEESTAIYNFTPTENLCRLRNSLRGEAHHAVAQLLHVAANPDQIMSTLEQCFGRPEVIMDQTINSLKKMPRVGNTAKEMNRFALKIQNIVTALECLGNESMLTNEYLIRHTLEKLDYSTRRRWCDFAAERGRAREPQMITLARFLMREGDRGLRFLHEPDTQPAYMERSTLDRGVKVNKKSAAVFVTMDSEAIRDEVCYCCGERHVTTKCHKLIAMPTSERWEWAKEARMCYQCFRSKHRRDKCTNARKCGINGCKRTHHTLLHSDNNKEASERVTVSAVDFQSSNTFGRALLKICPVTLKTDTVELETYALLDEGSTITLINEKLAQSLGASGPQRCLNICSVTSQQKEPASRVVQLDIKGRQQDTYHRMTARTVGNLVLGSQSINKESLNRPHLRGLPIEDICYENVKPQILIGADNWHLIVTRKLMAGPRNEPAASLTELGWTIHGAAPRHVVKDEQIYHVSEPKVDLHELVKAHFDIDSIGITLQSRPSANDKRALTIFEATVRRTGERYEVGLPWKSDDVILPPSYNMAWTRLKGIERKMDRSETFKIAYTAQVESLLEKGYASLCDNPEEENARNWYLPHFAVTNPNKPGKVRMVFDAAAKANGVCLNDMLLDGPDLLQTLHGILFRFREGPVAVTADIREMFLRVKIRKEDRTVQRFLWRGEDRRNPPRKYEMSSMIFGARSSPFLAHSVRNKNAEDNKESHPLAYTSITSSHYMDDWVESFDDEKTAARTMAEVIEVHHRGGFELAGWDSNRPNLLCDISQDSRARTPKELGANAHPYGKTLGILWLPDTDELSFNTALHRVPDDVKTGRREPTKREALSTVMSLFDPLGLISPYTITAKIILQGLWRLKIGWDEKLPPEVCEVFNQWQADREYIERLRIPRCYQTGRAQQRQLHVFCDASELAYAAVAYWRFKKRDGTIEVSLIAAKAKVAPMKAQSIPRMELQASLIGARLARDIITEHKYNGELTLWSDSKTALQWIRNDCAKYTPYVAHRLTEITEITRADQWRWVPTALNVADDATRTEHTRLNNKDRWFTGPAFLYEPQQYWPVEADTKESDDEITHAVVMEIPCIDVSRFSSCEKAVRIVALCLEFVGKCRKRDASDKLQYLKKAELSLVRLAQKDSFAPELQRLRKGKPVDGQSKLYKLDPVLGEDDVIRLHGRINAANVPEEMKSPPILDARHHWTRLLIRREHETQHHIGREHLVNNLRQKYWILRLRTTVRSIVNNCVTCKRRKGTPRTPVTGDLPRVRLDAYTRPFTRSGVDCFGPMWVTVGRRKEKRWGMIFTCLVTRAVHIELIPSLSTDSAIMAIRRMAARRGWPETIVSDNGTNFHGADEELRKALEAWKPTIRDFYLKKRINWKFIDPGAPNQGGAWERLIRTFKSSLNTILNRKTVREEVLSTLAAEIEYTMNARPLTHVSVSPDDPEALTPNHFLLGTANGMPHIGTYDSANRQVWKAAQGLADEYWRRWTREYLPTLTARGELHRDTGNITPGTIVLIVDGTLPRNVWPLGKVMETYPGPDGVVRSVDVWTKGGIFRRPVRRLVVLPVEKGCGDLRRGETVADDEPSH